jgi:hypothetical protein
VSPRANIFRRDQGNVHALEDLKHLMRYNDFQNDAFSNGQPVASVCARGDLAKKGAIPKGCYDTKVSDGQWLVAKSAIGSMAKVSFCSSRRATSIAPFLLLLELCCVLFTDACCVAVLSPSQTTTAAAAAAGVQLQHGACHGE